MHPNFLDRPGSIPMLTFFFFFFFWGTFCGGPRVCGMYAVIHTFAQAYLRRISYTRPQSLLGSLSQMWAALFHYVSPDRLAKINDSIPKIVILTGDNDHMVDPSNSFKLAAAMPNAEFIQWEETGHGVIAQWPKRVSDLLERAFEEGSAKVKAELEAIAPAGTA